MKSAFKKSLLNHKRKTITVEELGKVSPQGMTYEEFATVILDFEAEGFLEMVKSKGRNTRTPSLAYTYRIMKQGLTKEYHEELKRYRLRLHSSISLDTYFKLDPSVWGEDLPYLLKIQSFLLSKGFPIYEVPAPERSVELVGNEKWLTDHGGKELLDRVGLWEKMKVMPVSDPLMFALNPHVITNKTQKHLIVENKTTFQALSDVLKDTSFVSLIYGSGNKIIKSIEQFDRQLPLPGAEHHFYYFGDIDRSGIFIWHRLNEKVRVGPAMPFYKACLAKDSLQGKSNQRLDEEAIEEFLLHFSLEEKEHLQSVLENGCYYPQELLKTSELQDIWRQAIWN
jgi:hypothetical protein